MRPALPRQNENRGKQKNQAQTQEGEETDPLLSSQHHRRNKTIRRRSPLTTTSPPMRQSDASHQSDEYHDDRYSHQQTQYSLHKDDNTHYTSDGTVNLDTRTEATTTSQQNRRKRKQESHKPADDKPYRERPPLLEIPEEIYAIRKAALQVLKPLTASWVSRFIYSTSTYTCIHKTLVLTSFLTVFPMLQS